jgi:hypothetical protein
MLPERVTTADAAELVVDVRDERGDGAGAGAREGITDVAVVVAGFEPNNPIYG